MGLYVKRNDMLVTIANNNVSTINAFVGATNSEDGKSGVVPAPLIGDKDKFLRGDGTWGAGVSASVVTESADGLMSKEDKKKFNKMPMIFNSATEPTEDSVGDFWLQNY